MKDLEVKEDLVEIILYGAITKMETRAIYKMKIGTPDELTRCIIEKDRNVETLAESVIKNIQKGRISGINPKSTSVILVPRLIGIYQVVEPTNLDYKDVERFKEEIRDGTLELKQRLNYDFGVIDEINSNLICLVHDPKIIEKCLIEDYIKDCKARIKIAKYSEMPNFDAKDASVIASTFETLKKMREGGFKRETGIECIKYNLGTLEEQLRDYGLTTTELFYTMAFRDKVQNIVTPSSFETEIVAMMNTLASRLLRR